MKLFKGLIQLHSRKIRALERNVSEREGRNGLKEERKRGEGSRLYKMPPVGHQRGKLAHLKGY